MAKTATIYSTLTNHQTFVDWKDGPDIPTRGISVTIRGGAGIVRKTGLITPFGVATDVTEEQLTFLLTLPDFNNFIQRGWLKIQKSSGWKTDADVVAADMQQRDGSAPLVPNDYVDGKAPIVGAVGGTDNSEGTPPTTKPRTVPLKKPLGSGL